MDTIDFVKTDCSDLSCHTGVTFIVDMIVYQECGELPDDLTNYTARILFYNEIETTIIVNIVGSITEPAKGKIHFEISATNTALLPIGMYSHHLEITSIGGVVYRLAEGAFEINQ